MNARSLGAVAQPRRIPCLCNQPHENLLARQQILRKRAQQQLAIAVRFKTWIIAAHSDAARKDKAAGVF